MTPGYEIFYIDPDDEIPSFVARMKSTNAGFLVLVVPQRALLFSSAITMRLLKKEAEKLEKDIVVVTQDEQGYDMAKRSGFMVRRSLDELPFVPSRNPSVSGRSVDKSRMGASETPLPNALSVRNMLEREITNTERAIPVQTEVSAQTDQSSLETLRPASENIQVKKTIAQDVPISRSHERRSIAQSLASSIATQETRNVSDVDNAIVRKQKAVSRIHTESDRSNEVGSSAWHDAPRVQQTSSHDGKISGVAATVMPSSSRQLSSPRQKTTPTPTSPKKSIPEKHQRESESSLQYRKNPSISGGDMYEDSVGSRAQWIVAIAFFVLLGMIVGVSMFLYVPEAKVIVYPKTMRASGDVNYEAYEDSQEIPVRFLEIEETLSVSAPATGAVRGEGSKARGSVVLYNAFSKEPQSLVATTRLESSEGKIFRIVQSVTIPGYTEDGGAVTPGSVTVDVQSDEGGEAYNIGAGKFTIPGFSSSEKREKIYAESREPMVGGGSGDVKERSVTDGDIAVAEQKAREQMKQTVMERAKSDVASGITFEDLMEITLLEKTATPSVGMVAETFELSAKVRARYAVFSQENARDFATRRVFPGYTEGSVLPEEVRGEVEYGKMTVNFDEKKVDMKMFASIEYAQTIPLEDIRRDVLGGNENRLQELLDVYPQVDRFDVEIQKSYMQKTIPTDPDKVIVEIRA